MSVLRVIVLSGAFASVVAALPLSFEQRSALQFRTQLHGMPVTIGPNVVSFGSIRLRFEGASAQVRLAGIGKPVPATYVSARARQTFRQYPKLALRHLYPGVDAVFYGNGSELEYDLTFQPGARAEDLRLSFEGARGLRIDDDGNLVIQSQAETVTQKAPHAYQADGTGIDTHFVLVSRFTVGLRVGRHDPKQPMTIDPQLVYSSTLGSSKGIGPSLVATDSQGNIYLAGRGNPGGFPGTSDASADIAVPLLALSNAAGSAVSFTIGNAETVNAIGGSPDGSTLYAATPGAIYSSIDDGATWTPAGPLPLPTPAISGIAVDPGNAARVFLATSQGIFFSGDGGQTWALNNPAAVSWVTMSRDSSLAYATSATTLYQSSDGGVTWNVLNPGGLSPAIAAVALDGSALYVITQAGSLFESSDAGSTWTALGTGPAMAQTLLVDPTNASNVYVLAASNIFKSTDGGFTFKTSLFQTTTANKALQITLDSTGTLFVAGQLPTGDIWIYASPDQVQWVPKAETPNLHSLVTIGNRVFAGFDATSNTFVTKLDPTGTQILYSTFLGGSSVQLSGLQVDAQGNCIIAGTAFNPDFPATTQIAGPLKPNAANAFVAKLSQDGTRLIYSTLVSQSSIPVNGMTIDASGAVYLTGETSAPGFPTSANAFQPTSPCSTPLGTAFAARLDNSGASLTWATYLNIDCTSTGSAIAVNANGEIVVAANGTVMKLSPNGDQLRGSYTLNVGQSTKALALAIDPAGDIAVTGYTLNDAPMGTPGAYQAVSTNQCFYQPMSSLHLPYLNTDVFVMKLDPALTSPRFVSYLSGNCADQGNAIATDASGNVWVLGDSASFDFPTRALYQGAGFPNGFVSELSADGSQLLFSSGTDGLGMAFDPSGSLLLTGSQLTIAPTSWELIKIDPLTNPGAVIDQIQPVNYDTGTVTTAFNTIAGVAPGQLVRIKGSHLGPEVKVYAQTDSGSFPSSLADVTVSFDQVRAPIVSVQAGEIICVAPFEISQFTQISVFAGGQQSNQVRMSVVSAWPAIVSILNADGIPNSPDHPAQVGSTVWLYLSGLGPTLPPDTDGAVNATNVLPRANPSLFADGIQVGTIAAAPGQPAGVFRVSVTTPKPQNGSGKVSMILTISPNLSSVAANLYVGP